MKGSTTKLELNKFDEHDIVRIYHLATKIYIYNLFISLYNFLKDEKFLGELHSNPYPALSGLDWAFDNQPI